MSQQEFFQGGSEKERQSSSSHAPDWNSGRSKGGIPKDVPVGDDDFAMLHGYRTQEYGPWEQGQPASTSTQNTHIQPEQSVPDWARPQKNNSRGVLIALIVVVGLVLIKPLLIVAGILLALLGVSIGIALLGTIFMLVFFAIIVGFALLVIRAIFSRATRPRRFYDRRYWRRYRRGYRW